MAKLCPRGRDVDGQLCVACFDREVDTGQALGCRERELARARERRWYEKNRAAVLERDAQWRKEHPGMNHWHQTNREHMTEYARRYREEHRAQLNAKRRANDRRTGRFKGVRKPKA